MFDEVFSAIRGIGSMGVVLSVDDTGQAQTVTVMSGNGALRANVEVLQLFGFSSVPPAHGGICLLLAVGADPANLRALPIACPAARFGTMGVGESALYASDGTRIHAKPDGTIEIWAGKAVTVNAPTINANATISANVTAPAVAVNATNSVVLTTPIVVVTGTLYVEGEVYAQFTKTNITLSSHVHADPQGGDTGTPVG